MLILEATLVSVLNRVFFSFCDDSTAIITGNSQDSFFEAELLSIHSNVRVVQSPSFADCLQEIVS